MAIAASRRGRDDIAGILRPVPAQTPQALAEALAPLTEDPPHAAIFCDIDGVLAPIVTRAEDAQVPEEASLLLGRLARRYGCVACISGRSAADARRLVGVGGIAYAGSHGAELLEPGATSPRTNPAFKSWEGRVRGFVAERDDPDLRRLRVRIEDKGPIAALHWRGAPDEDAARDAARGDRARGRGTPGSHSTGAARCWRCGRRSRSTRARRCATWSSARTCAPPCSAATTPPTSTPSTLSTRWSTRARSTRAVRVGVHSDEGPPAIVERADLVVDGVDGFAPVLEALAES